MKKYLKEIIILLFQLFMFYVFPLFCGETDVMGMVILIFLSVFILSFVLGLISKERIKYLYPIIVMVIFVPTLFIYYDISAAIYLLWHFVVSLAGLAAGIFIRFLSNKISEKWKVSHEDVG